MRNVIKLKNEHVISYVVNKDAGFEKGIQVLIHKNFKKTSKYMQYQIHHLNSI